VPEPQLLQSAEVVTAIIAVAGSIALALIGWFTGFFGWLGKQIEKSLDERRELRRQVPKAPKTTLRVVADTISGASPPTQSQHVWPTGRCATDCMMFLTITNLMRSSAVRPLRAAVRLRGVARLRRKVYDARLHQMEEHKLHGFAPPGLPTQWQITFNVFPAVKRSVVAVDIIVYDHFGNGHKLKDVRFLNQAVQTPPYVKS
jgi:hypothetical protein